MGSYDNRDRNYNRNDRMQQGGGRNQQQQQQQRQYMGGSTSTSSYLSGNTSQRYDDDDRSGGNKGGRGRGGNGGPMQSGRPQGGPGGKGSLHGSKSIGESRPLKMEVMAMPVRGNVSIEDTDAKDQSFLDLVVEPSILQEVLKKMMDSAQKLDEHNEELAKLTSKSLMSQENATPLQVVKKQVYDLMTFVLERKEKGRELCGQLLAHCINNKYLSRSVFVSSLGQLLGSIVDIIIDVPKVWEYIPEFLGEFSLRRQHCKQMANLFHSVTGPAMLESQINLTDVAHALEVVEDDEKLGEELIKVLGKYFVRIRQPKVLFDMWSRDKLSWAKFVRRYKTEDEIKEHFLVPNVSYPL